jgi:hypothetical protein
MKRSRSVRNFIWVAIATVSLLLVCVKQSNAQTVNGSIVGTVKDSQGAAMANATVAAKSQETGAERTTMTDASGGYNIVSIPAGAYDVAVTAQGFESQIQKSVTLTVGSTQRVDFTLKVGSVSQQVEVTGEAPQINTSNATVGGLIDDSSIRQLPLNGRDWLQLALTQSNVVFLTPAAGSGGTGAGVKMFIAGGRSTQNVFRVDGFVVNDYGNNSPGNALGINMGVDAIREFTVLSNAFSAEYGRSAGGVVNSILKSGTNQIHGTGFYFIRNSALDARNIFDPQVIPKFRRNQFGASVGGPIKKDKLFFFADYEGIRQFNPAAAPSTNTISNDARNGLIVCDPTKITDGTCVKQSSGVFKKQYTVSPKTAPYLPLFPTPTLAATGDTGVYTFAGGAPGKDNYVIGKVDYQINANNLFSVSYNFDQALTDTPDNYNDKKSLNESRTQRAIVTFQHVFTPTLLNTFRTGISRINAPAGAYHDPANSAVSDTSLGFAAGHTVGAFSLSFIGSFTPGGLDVRGDTYHYMSPQASDDLSWVKGRNNIRIGASFEDINTNLVSVNFPAGQWTFAQMSDFITATNPTQYNQDFPGSDPYRSYRGKVFGAYFVDDVRVLPNLTVNLGVRYEPETVPTEAYNKASVIIKEATDGPGSPYRDNPIYNNNSLKNFAPRVGLAWDPFKDGKTSVRAGFGIYDILVTPNLFALRLNRSYPYYNQGIASTSALASCATGSCLYSGGLPLLTATSKLTTYVQPNPPASYKMQWNLNIQRQLTSTLSLTVGYIGSKGNHQAVAENDVDYVPPQFVTLVNGHYTFPWAPACPTGAVSCGGKVSLQPVTTAAKLNTNWSRIQGISFYGYSMYHGLQVTTNKQMGHGLSFNGSYTYSKSIDNGGQEYTSNEFAGSISNPWPFITDLQRGPSDFDVRHQFTLNFVYDIPSAHIDNAAGRFLTSGWELTSIFSARSALPFSIGIPTDQAATAGFISTGVHVAQRPDFNPKAAGCNATTPQGGVTGDRNNYLNLACFPYPAPGTLGNLPRNALRGLPLQDLDFSIFKNDKLFRERLNVQFRAEMFNILNHANFQALYTVPYSYNNVTGTCNLAPSGACASTVNGASNWFGSTVTSARQIQFGLKFIY